MQVQTEPFYHERHWHVLVRVYDGLDVIEMLSPPQRDYHDAALLAEDVETDARGFLALQELSLAA